MKSAGVRAKNFFSSGSSYSPTYRKVFFSLLIIVCGGLTTVVRGQEYVRSSWWFGVAGGTNYNLYHGSYPHQLNTDTEITGALGSGKGTGYFAFPLLEYHPEGKSWGFFLQAGYDSRFGTFDNQLKTKLAYFTVEPSLRLNLSKSPIYIFAGPRVAINVDKRFTYQQNSGTLDNMKRSVSSFQVGAGWDIHLNSPAKSSQVIMAPFFAFQPYFGQSPRTTDSWNVTTLRAGIAFKFGRSRQFAESRQVVVPVTIDDKTRTSLVDREPPTAQEEGRVDKSAPIGNQAYFDLLPSKLIDPAERQDKRKIRQLRKEMIALTEDEAFSAPLRSDRVSDNNFITIIGKQLQNDPSATIMLIGSSKNGARYAESLAKSVKLFLTGVFGIDGDRVKIKSHRRLKIHPGTPKGEEDLALLFEKDRQLLMRSKSARLQQKFRGEDAEKLNQLKIKVIHEPDVDGFVTFGTQGAQEPFVSWSLKISDGNGPVQKYGPYTGETARIQKSKILGGNTVGEYQVSMIGQFSSGETIGKDTTIVIRIYPLRVGEKFTRFGISYEYNNLQSISDLNNYLAKVVAPEIPENAKVIIHGHSNRMEEKYFDLKSYLTVANDAHDMLQNALVKAGKTGVQFEVYGLGEDQIVEPFRKVAPTNRQYFRTLIIDVVPASK